MSVKKRKLRRASRETEDRQKKTDAAAKAKAVTEKKKPTTKKPTTKKAAAKPKTAKAPKPSIFDKIKKAATKATTDK